MSQVDQNINKDMIDSDLIDVETIDFSDGQTCLYSFDRDSGHEVDILDWNMGCDWPMQDDDDYMRHELELQSLLDSVLKNENSSMPDKHKFDSRTYVRPKKRMQRPSIHSMVEDIGTHEETDQKMTSAMNAQHILANSSSNKFMTYNKYNSNPISPMLRLKTFSVEANTENSNAVKDYALKRRSQHNEDDPLEDVDITLASDTSSRLSGENLPSKPINIDLTQPAHNLHNTFNKGLTNALNDRGSYNMYQSGDSLMRMSPPSLVSSMVMESSGNFAQDIPDGKRSSLAPSLRDSAAPTPRESLDHNSMMTSMTLSILDEKDMSTSFLSQTTYPDEDSLIDSLPPSLVSSVNSSYIVSNAAKPRNDSRESSLFSSGTYTALENSERLLTARPRCNLYKSFTRPEQTPKSSASYTKSRDDPSEALKTLSNLDTSREAQKTYKPTSVMSETISLHYTNNKFQTTNEAEKENMNSTFEKDDTFYKDMKMQRAVDLEKNSLNVTLDKQELNEIIQARQKLSLARKALPSEPARSPNQNDVSPHKTIHLPNQTITVPRQSLENASELLARRRISNSFEKREEMQRERESPKRNATFKRSSPPNNMDATMVYVKSDATIDINVATVNLIDASNRTLRQEEWGSNERAMVGSSESTDTATFSSSSPPESVPEQENGHRVPHQPVVHQVASTPVAPLRKGKVTDLMSIHNTISPIYDMLDDKSYTVLKPTGPLELKPCDSGNTTIINTATIVRKHPTVKRDILAGNKISPEPRKSEMRQPNRVSPTSYAVAMAPPITVPRKTGLPTSKLRQYSSHKELSRIPAGGPRPAAIDRVSGMARRPVYASNPALSPTQPHPPISVIRRDSYTVACAAQSNVYSVDASKRSAPVPPLVRQGTETLTYKRPLSQLVAPQNAPTTRQYVAPPTPAPQPTPPRVRPGTAPVSRPAPAPVEVTSQRCAGSAASNDGRGSGLPRPSRLPAPRRALRPPSVYSVAPGEQSDHY